MPSLMKLVPASSRSLSPWARVAEAIRSYTVGPMSLKDPALSKLWGGGRSTSAGIIVSDLMAYTFSAVYRAVDGISSDVAKVPLNHRKWRKEGGSDLYDNSTIAELLKVRANPDMSAFTFRQTVQAHALTAKGGFAEIERDGSGRPIALWVLEPDRVQPFVDQERLSTGRYRGVLRYRIDGKTVLDAADVIHIRGLSADGYCAYPVIDQARQAIGLALAAEQFGATFFGNGTVFGGVMSTDNPVGPELEAQLRESIEKYHQSADKAHRLLFAAGGWKYTQTGIAPNEAQMDELRDKQVEEVARFFDYPLYKLKLAKPGAVSYASAEMSDTDYYKSLMKWFVNWEQELQWKLIPKTERYQQFIKHNTNAFLRGDTAARGTFYQMMLNAGVFCADDVLELEDMNPQPNGQGKLYLVQAAQVPKDRLDDIVDAQIASKKAKANPPAPAPNDPAPARDDKAIALLESRLQEAESSLLVAQDESRQAREAFAAAEATGLAKAGELERLAATGAGLDALSLQLSATVDALRGDLDAARARVEVEQTARLAAEAAAATCERAMRAAEAAAVAATEAERVTAEQARQAQERATVAEQVSDDLRGQITSLEASATVSAADVVAARQQAEADAEAARRLADEREAERHAAHLAKASAEEALAAAHAELEAAQRVLVEARECQHTAEDARHAAETAAEHAQRLASEKEAERQAAMLSEQASAAALAASRFELDEAHRLVESARREQQLAEEARTAAESSRQAEVDARTAAQAQLSKLEQQLAEAHATTATQTHDLDVLVAREQELHNHVTDARAQLAAITGALDATRGAHEGSAAALAAAVEALERDRADAATQIAELRASWTAAHERMVAMEEEVRLVKQADAASITSLITAHRDLVSDVMRRMVERETDHARRAQRTPEKLSAWIESFYEGHDELMRAALLPAIRVHLAFIRSNDDPVETTRRLVAQHVQQSQVQLRQVVAGDAEPFAASVSALLYRWDRERSTVIADALMAKELDYARTL
jgi:HK97 family phage portal protein